MIFAYVNMVKLFKLLINFILITSKNNLLYKTLTDIILTLCDPRMFYHI